MILPTTFSLMISSCDDKPEPASNAVTGAPKLDGPVTFTLADAEARHREAPDTFQIPDAEARAALDTGNAVKLIFEITDDHRTEVERMWVLITKRNGDLYEGTLENDPYCTDELRSGAPVTFEPRHIIQIEEDEAGAEE